MKHLKFLILFLLISFFVKGQSVDSIFFIVDKNADYIEYTKGPGINDFKIIVNCKWQDNYYSDEVPMGFHYYEYGTNDEKLKLKINPECYLFKIEKKHLKRYIIVDTEWVHNQENELDVWKKIPSSWCVKKIPFVIFKEDLQSCNDSITAYLTGCYDGVVSIQFIQECE